MKRLVVFYSRSGVTKKIAQKISKRLKADIEEIIDLKDRSGAIGYLKAGRDATLKKLTKIKSTKKSPKNYDIVIIGTPVWAWTISPAIRTYIETNKDDFKKVAFFCTMGGDGDKQSFQVMQKLCKKKPLKTCSLKTAEVTKSNCDKKLERFCECLK